MSSVDSPFVTTGTYPTRSGNRVQPWIDGEPAFRRICEAIESAQQAVWVTVTFMWPSFQMPDGRGSALEFLERSARRGIDVRILFWRPDEDMPSHRRNAFWGSTEHFMNLAESHPSVKIRWDRAHTGYCQHQKSWLIDADSEVATSFIGGINLNPHSLVSPGHEGEGHNHDIYLEMAGPATADVQHNFVQRWNEASERTRDDGRWGPGSELDLTFPVKAPPVRGTATVQIQRTTHSKRYIDCHPPVGGIKFSIAEGEKTNLDQYCQAINSASRTIYMENQYLEVPEIVVALQNALTRGVEVLVLLPAESDFSSRITNSPTRAAFISARSELGVHQSFSLCGIAGLRADGKRSPIYVHAKVMLIDDQWATVGSCNLHHYSLFGNGEMNVAVLDPAMVRAMRVELFQEHLATDTENLDDRAAHGLFRRIANENRERLLAADPNWQGLAFALDIASYGTEPQFNAVG